ncbi:hypothetical protein MU516_19300 [Paracoccus sp. YLB-12]|uniref:Uncharacterized protein n=1 Tax=Paracoccus maritimus TaxID=2933292 RepID=A0ABT2KEK3_9RHOB|nr:hypothetical protein [Paracoccus sp. YLB-12]MCT4334972.1 hypothetical protein [Paracoccus sp. YLB-12]
MLAPDPRGRGLTIDLHGALASLLRLATGMPVTGLAAEMQKAPRKAGRKKTTNAQSAEADLQDADFSEKLALFAGLDSRNTCLFMPQLGQVRWPSRRSDNNPSSLRTVAVQGEVASPEVAGTEPDVPMLSAQPTGVKPPNC